MNGKIAFIALFLTILSVFASPSSALNPKFKKYYFLPSVIKTSNAELSNIIVDYYKEQYISKNKKKCPYIDADGSTINCFSNPDIQWSKWQLVFDSKDKERLYKSSFSSNNSSIYLQISEHSWRGDIHEVYMVRDDEEQGFTRNFPDNKESFYSYGFVWSNIFRFGNELFFLEHSDLSSSLHSASKLYKINADSSVTEAASFKISEHIYDIAADNKFPAFISFWRTMHNIFGTGTESQLAAGTMRAHDRARLIGHNSSKKAIIAPWDVSAAKDGYHIYNNRLLQYVKDWGLWEAWNYREYLTLLNHIPAAELELCQLYHKEYGLNKDDATRLAKQNIESVIASYIIVPNTYPEFRENAILDLRKKVTLGEYKKSFLNEKTDAKLSYDYSEESGAEKLATFAIDNMQNLKSLIEKHGYNNLTNAFSKTLLMYAAHMNNYGAVKFLVDRGVNVNDKTQGNKRYLSHMDLPNNLERTALTYALENSSIEVIAELIENGAEYKADYVSYLKNNPRFSDSDKKLSIKELIQKNRNEGGFFKASFNCEKATSKIEKAVCSDKTLAIYDRELGRAYLRLLELSQFKSFDKREQIRWWKERNKECQKLDGQELKQCLIHSTRARVRYMHNRINTAPAKDI